MRRASLLAALAFFAACGPTPIDDRRQDLLAQWGAWMLERYATAATSVDALGGAITALCEAPDTTRLDAARAAWDAARRPWKEAEVFAFGPYSEEPLRLGPKADFWPARDDAVREVLAADTPIDVNALGSPQKGFTAIEVLLWDPQVDVVAALGDTPRRCDYLTVLSADLAARIRELALAWDPSAGDYLGELTDAGERTTRYASLHRAFGEMVNRVGYLIENIRNDKLARPAGLLGDGTVQPEKLESHLSDRSLDDIRDNLAGARHLLLGDGDDLGLDGYLRTRGRHFRQLVSDRFAAVDDALDALGDHGALASALATDAEAPALVDAVVARLAELQRTVQVDMLGALSLNVGFNDNDGD